jgi:5'-nucleotidase
VFTTEANLTANSDYGIVKAGQPSVGPDPSDDHIWYYNGTPSACVQVALDYVLPFHANISTPDLVLAGPNYGLNPGPFLYTLSGTMGATYTAIERGIPAIAFSGGYSVQTPYYNVNTTTAAGLKDPATIYGELSANLAQQIIKNTNGSRILPLGYGINVNLPYITSFTNDSCVDPPFVHTRLTSGAVVDRAVYNETSRLFSYGNIVSAGANVCINGDCSLPGEATVLSAGCQSSVSVFTVDYDAPTCNGAESVRVTLSPLVQSINSSSLVGGLNGASSAGGSTNSTVPVSTSVSPPVTTFTGGVTRLKSNTCLGILFATILAAITI